MNVNQREVIERQKYWKDHYARHGFWWLVNNYTSPDGDVIVGAFYRGNTACGFISIELNRCRLIIDGDMGFAVAYLTDATFDALRKYSAIYLAEKIVMTNRTMLRKRDYILADSMGAWVAALQALPKETIGGM